MVIIIPCAIARSRDPGPHYDTPTLEMIRGLGHDGGGVPLLSAGTFVGVDDQNHTTHRHRALMLAAHHFLDLRSSMANLACVLWLVILNREEISSDCMPALLCQCLVKEETVGARSCGGGKQNGAKTSRKLRVQGFLRLRLLDMWPHNKRAPRTWFQVPRPTIRQSMCAAYQALWPSDFERLAPMEWRTSQRPCLSSRQTQRNAAT